MSKIKKINPSILTKILLALLFVFSGILIFILMQIGNRNGIVGIDSVQAASCIDTEYASCCQRINVAAGRPAHGDGEGVGGNCLSSDVQRCVSEANAICNSNNNPGLPQCSSGNYSAGQCQCGQNICYINNPTCNPTNANECIPRGFSCRYRTGGGHCALSDFYEGCTPGDGQICVCTGGDTRSEGGWTYARVTTRPIDQYVECGAPSAEYRASVCADPANAGKTFTGRASECDNPWMYRCPGTTTTPTPTPIITTTPTTTPTNNPVPECIGISSKSYTLSPGQSVVVTMQVRNVENNEGRLFIFNRGNPTCDGVGVPCPAYIPARESDTNEQGQPINSPIRIDSTQKRYFFTTGDNLNPVKTYRWTITYEQLFGTSSNPIVDANNNQVLRDVQLNGYTWGLAPHGYDHNCVTRITQSLQPPSPNIEVSKTLVSPNFQPVGSTITFNINARNTGNVDIRNFTLSDQYDPNYLEFVSSTYRGQTLNPDATTGTNGRMQLTWSNMPPKSGFSGEDGVLTAGSNGNGETFTLTLTFRILREVTPSLALENDNCGIITTITYRDEFGQDRQDTLNPPRQSCVEFYTPTEVPLTVQVNKTTLTPSVVSPTEVRFRATITNNDSNQRTYSDIDFTDVYDATYLRPNRVIVTNPSGRSATVSGFTLNGSLVIQNLQDLCSAGTSLRAPCDGGGTPLGELPIKLIHWN